MQLFASNQDWLRPVYTRDIKGISVIINHEYLDKYPEYFPIKGV